MAASFQKNFGPLFVPDFLKRLVYLEQNDQQFTPNSGRDRSSNHVKNPFEEFSSGKAAVPVKHRGQPTYQNSQERYPVNSRNNSWYQHFVEKENIPHVKLLVVRICGKFPSRAAHSICAHG
ncbi:hypothetical protein [Acidihalobacter prosperus]